MADVVRENIVPRTVSPSVDVSSSAGQQGSTVGLATALVFQVMSMCGLSFLFPPPRFSCALGSELTREATVVAGILIGITAFFLKRRRRRGLESQRDEQRALNAAFFGRLDISAPNGLDTGRSSHVPPTYQDALKSAASIKSADPGHRRHMSESMLMDECMRAAYATEDDVNGGTTPKHGGFTSSPNKLSANRNEPTSPLGVARADVRQSVSRWMRNQRRLGAGPLSSNPPETPGRATARGLPVPPSPSYTGVPPTPSAPSAPQTPVSAPYHEPPSVRSTGSYMTGDDRLSIQASIPDSVMYPSPLQPAPAPRRLTSGASRNRASATSVQEYGGETWTTMTPHEDPPGYGDTSPGVETQQVSAQRSLAFLRATSISMRSSDALGVGSRTVLEHRYIVPT